MMGRIALTMIVCAIWLSAIASLLFVWLVLVLALKPLELCEAKI
jgi:hypothetical protein